MTERLALLEQRMSVLERRNRSLAAVTLIALLVAAAPYLMGARQSGTVLRAGRFEVVNPSGQVVAALNGNASGGTLDLFTNSGVAAGYFGASTSGTSLDLRDPAGKLVGWVDSMRNGGAGLCLQVADAANCGVFVSAEGVGGRMTLRDATGAPRLFP
jgi:hypothetical protein